LAIADGHQRALALGAGEGGEARGGQRGPYDNAASACQGGERAARGAPASNAATAAPRQTIRQVRH